MRRRRLEVFDFVSCGHVLQLDQHVEPHELCEGHVLVGCWCKRVHNVRSVPCGKLLSQRRHREPPRPALQERTCRSTGRRRRRIAACAQPARTAPSQARHRFRNAARALGRLRSGRHLPLLVKHAPPARTPSWLPPPTSQHASLVMLALTRPSRELPRRRRAKRALRGSTALRRPRLRCRALPARSCPPRAPCLSTGARVALWARTAPVTRQQHPRCVRQALTSQPPARSTAATAWAVLLARFAAPTA